MAEQIQIGINRIYVKDLSFESPAAPGLFNREFQPEIKVDIAVKQLELEGSLFEVTLEVIAKGTFEGKTCFIAEVEQAGLFFIQGVAAEQMNHVLRVYCPNILFPYARQAIDTAMNQGSFPSLLLPSFNFESLLRSPQSN